MANTKSAKKAARVIARRTDVNRMRRTQMRSAVRKAEEAIASGDAKAAESAFRAVQPALMKAAQKGIVHRNTAERKISRLAKRMKTGAKA